MSGNSNASSGTYPGIIVGPDASLVRITNNEIGHTASYTKQLAPVQVVSANAGAVLIEGNQFANLTNRVVNDLTNPNDTTNTVKLFSAFASPNLIVRCNQGLASYGGSVNDCAPTLFRTGIPFMSRRQAPSRRRPACSR